MRALFFIIIVQANAAAGPDGQFSRASIGNRNSGHEFWRIIYKIKPFFKIYHKNIIIFATRPSTRRDNFELHKAARKYKQHPQKVVSAGKAGESKFVQDKRNQSLSVRLSS